tara:strand:- start:2299 stop:3948 length:1650 start_codon:yes stop_codon:yes gene_type:complete
MTLTKIDIDRSISSLRVSSKEFATIDNAKLITLFEECIQNIKSVAYYWATVAAENKGVTNTIAEGEEWLGGPFASVFGIQYYIDSLKDVHKPLDEKLYNKENNTYKVFPNNNLEKIFFPFISAEVKFNKNISFKEIEKFRGFAMRYSHKPSTTLVLGAGNVSSIPLLDTIFHLVTKRSVVYLKLNPVNEYLLPVYEKIFENFIALGYIVVSKGSTEESKYMVNHKGIDHIHLTGSDETYENIVYGKKLSDNEKNLKTLSKINKTSFSSELGNVTPIIIHPGNWSTSELKHQARKIVTAKLNNGGFNCISAQIVVLPEGWKHTDKLMKYIKQYMKNIDDRYSYYPNSLDKLNNLEKDKNYERLNDLSCATPHLSREIKAYSKFETSEIWGTSIYFKQIPYNNEEAYAREVIDYCNNNLWGNLGATVIFKKYKNKKQKPITNLYIEELKYGTVAINEWSAIGFIIPTLPWGGFPGNKDNDIQSGQDFVHNSLFFESAQNGIVYSKFRMSNIIDPLWFVTNKKGKKVFKNLTYFQIDKTLSNFIKLGISAVI